METGSSCCNTLHPDARGDVGSAAGQGITLVSHKLCPYVQRVAIVLAEKGAGYERRDIDLGKKPDWFLAISPLGKTPVLLVGRYPLFESAAICEYLDETIGARLHPDEPFRRAEHRAWMEYASAVLNDIGRFYSAPDAAALEVQRQTLADRFGVLEAALGDGPYFSGPVFGLVDAAFAPVFRYFDVFDRIADFGIFDTAPKVRAWRAVLAERPSVRAAAAVDYPVRLRDFLVARGSELSRRIA